MRLKRLLIRGFGQLRGELRLESGSATVALLLERNEAGKSTLAAAIVAALYGLESDRRRARGAKVAQDLYRPWGGGPYGLALTLELGGREVVIDRDLERSSVRVFEGAQDVTDRYQRGSRIAVGEILTGLSREQFLLSTFVGQGDIVWSDAAGLTEALQRVADSQGGKATAAAAVASLDYALAHYDGITLAGTGRVETEIERCRQAIETAQSDLGDLDALHAEFQEKIEGLDQDHLRDQQFAWQREALRARRLRSEANALEEVLKQDVDLQHQVQQVQSQLERAGDLDRLKEATLRELDVERRRYEGSLRDLDREVEAADTNSARRSEAVAVRDAMGLRRRPTEEDANVLWQASVRHEDAGKELSRLEPRLVDQERELQTRGFRLERAQQLAESFEEIREEDRARLSGRTQELLRLEEKRTASDEQLAVERQREITILRSQASMRRTGWGVTVLAVGFAAAIVIFASRLPLSLTAVRTIAVGLLAIGPALVLSASRRGRTELGDCRTRMRQLHEGQLRLTEDEAEIEGRWQELSRRLRVDPDELEGQYREYRTVESAARGVASLQARLRDLDRAQVQALREASKVAEVFSERDQDCTLSEKLGILTQAIKRYQVADQAAAVADAARQRMEMAKNTVRQTESALRHRLREAGIEITVAESIESGFDRLRCEVEQLRQARQLRDETLPALSQRLLEPAAHEANRRHLEEIRSEGLRLQSSIAERMRDLGADLSQLEEILAQPLSQAEYDELVHSLRLEEDMCRATREAERTQVHAFLSRYESEAPALRASMERHGRALRRAEEYQAAVTLSRNALEEIGRDTHRTWSAAINKHCNEILRGLDSRADRLSFGEDLSLRIEQEGQLLTDQDAVQHLSVGALDAVYLAARIAVSRFLSGGLESLPLVLDDPFANADDPRLLSGVKMLIEQIAPHQQVLLMACQRSRYEWLRDEMGRPEELVTLEVLSPGLPRSDDDRDGTHHARA